MLKLLKRFSGSAALCGLFLAAAQEPCFAQAAGGASSQIQAAADEQPIPPAIARELAAMQRRIDELEAELKTQRAANASSAPASGRSSAGPALVNAVFPAKTSAAEGTSEAPLSVSPTDSPLVSQDAKAATATATAIGVPTKPVKSEPFAFADFTWLNGNSREKDVPFDTKFFTPEFRADVDYVYDFNHPKDDSIGGSSEIFRSDEVQITQLAIGGDFHWNNVRGRLLTQFGMYSETTPRNDASPARGQWNLADAYRYLSEAYGGYHFDVLHGVNVDAGIFMSYIGLFSYYNYDNWAYQPSYVSSNTPWFFNGVRVQIFPSDKLKLEPWFINGWQSYGRFNHRPGLGGQILWRPNGWLSFVFNNYGMGTDTLGVPGRSRIHTDDSVQVKFYDKPNNLLDKMAFSLTGDAGCEYGGGVSCHGTTKGGPKQSFLGFMYYQRFWFDHDLFGLTVGGGRINNPGRYLVLLPPINGATAATGTPYFSESPGDQYKAWDASATIDYMPRQYVTFRWEFNHRAASVPYFTGPGGITPAGGNTGDPTQIVPGFTPDLRKIENRLTLALLVKF